MMLLREPTPTSRRGSRIGHVLLWGGLGLLFGLLLVYPIVMVVIAAFTDRLPRPGVRDISFTLDNLASLSTSATAQATINTIVLGAGGTLLALFIGITVAWLAARTNVVGAKAVYVMGIAPMFISAVVGAIAWSFLGSPRSGYITLFLNAIGLDWTFNIHSLPGMILVLGLYYAPYPFLLLYSSFTLMDEQLEEAGLVHGASLPTVMRRVTLPLLMPALLGSALLCFALIMENFPVPAVLGAPADIHTLPTRVFSLVNRVPSAVNEAAALGCVLMVLVGCFLIVQNRVLRSRDYTTVSGKSRGAPRPIDLGRWRYVALAWPLLYILLAIGLPVFALLQGSLRSHQFVPDIAALFDVSAFSMRHYAGVLADDAFRRSLLNSVLVGSVTAIAGGALFFMMAFISVRGPGRFARAVEYIATLPLGIPAIVLGLGILWAWLTLPLPVHGTLAILVFAYIARFMPQGFRAIAGSIRQIGPELEESARVHGAGYMRSIWRITVPLTKSGLFSAVMLLLVLSMRELTTSLFLFTADTRVVAIYLYEQFALGSWPRAAVVSLLYGVLLFAVTVLGRKWMTGGDRVTSR